jgi:hypothetical protein
MSGDASKLDGGEALLERYLVEHEQLLPTAVHERLEIYELLGQYTLRRDHRPPPNVNTHLQELVRDTHANLQRPTPRSLEPNEDPVVREIEVKTIPWAKLDDPRVQAYLRDPRYTGPSLFERVTPYNDTRVLVRGFVGEPLYLGDPANRHAYATLAAARADLERCYEEALSRGAETTEQVALELRWDGQSPTQIEIVDQTLHDNHTSRCVLEALRKAESTDADASGRAELRLTFFVQPPRFPPYMPADITHEALPEDASITRCVRGPMRC